jgi:hypothetical protein
MSPSPQDYRSTIDIELHCVGQKIVENLFGFPKVQIDGRKVWVDFDTAGNLMGRSFFFYNPKNVLEKIREIDWIELNFHHSRLDL